MESKRMITKTLSFTKKHSLANIYSTLFNPITVECERLPNIINSPLKSVALLLKDKQVSTHQQSSILAQLLFNHRVKNKKSQEIHRRQFSEIQYLKNDIDNVRYPETTKCVNPGKINDINFINIEFYKKLSHATKGHGSIPLKKKIYHTEIKEIPSINKSRFGLLLRFPTKTPKPITKFRATTPLADQKCTDLPYQGNIGIQSSETQNRKIVYLKLK